MTRFHHTMISQGIAALSMVGLTFMSAAGARASEALVPVAQSQDTAQSRSLSDVPPDNWAYQAVQSLMNNYGCLAGYPDGTFRGDQAVTRYEFAAGMNACLDAISGFAQQRQGANQAEVDQLIQSMQQLHNDLNDLENRVGPLEGNAPAENAPQK